MIEDVLEADPGEVLCLGDDGAMIAHGRLWANGDGIYVINVPDR